VLVKRLLDLLAYVDKITPNHLLDVAKTKGKYPRFVALKAILPEEIQLNQREYPCSLWKGRLRTGNLQVLLAVDLLQVMKIA